MATATATRLKTVYVKYAVTAHDRPRSMLTFLIVGRPPVRVERHGCRPSFDSAAGRRSILDGALRAPPARDSHLPEDTPAPAAPDSPATPDDAAAGDARRERYGVWVKRWSLAGSRTDPESLDADGRATIVDAAADVDIGAEVPDQLDLPPALPDPSAAGGGPAQVDVKRELRAVHAAIAALRREVRAGFTPDTAGSDPADPASETNHQTPPAPR